MKTEMEKLREIVELVYDYERVISEGRMSDMRVDIMVERIIDRLCIEAFGEEKGWMLGYIIVDKVNAERDIEKVVRDIYQDFVEIDLVKAKEKIIRLVNNNIK